MSLPVIITVTGSSFSPKLALKPGSTATVTWDCPSASVTVTGLNPTLSFGSAVTRTVYMTVVDANGYEAIGDIQLFNIGFNHLDDQGVNSLSSAYDYTAQAVTHVDNIGYMHGLLYFCAAGIGGLTGTLDFSGCSQLQNIELYNSGITGILLEGCGSLLRLVTESNNLTQIDINPVASSIQEIRSAFQDTGKLNVLPLSNSYLAVVEHFCVRDQILSGIPNLSSVFPAIKELWIWNARQSGAFSPVSKNLDWVLAHSNNYVSADLTGQMLLANGILDLSANQLITCDLTGCTGLKTITLCDNAFSSAEVDTILSVVDGWGTSSGTLNLSGNPAPGSTGNTHKTNLQGRGWTVTTGPGGVSVIQTASASGSQNCSFASPVTVGNSVLYVAGAYTQSSSAMTASNVKLGGNTVTGTAAAFDPSGAAGLNSGFNSGDGVHLTAWLLPDVQAAASALSMSIAGGNPTGCAAFEVSGLGSSPAFHRAISIVGSSGTDLDPGQMSQITISPAFVLGLAQGYAGLSAAPSAPWTTEHPNTPTMAAWRTTTEPGGNESFNWVPVPSGPGPFCAGLLVIG